MNSAGKHAVIALLVISVAGCTEKKANTTPPAQAQAPALDAGKAGALYPPPLTTSSTQPENPAPAPAPVVAQTQPTPPPQPPPSNTGKTNSKHKSKPPASKATTTASTPTAGGDAATTTAAANPAPAAATDATTTIAASGEPAAASPIGQLSTGTAGQTQSRKDTVDLITNTENGVNGIKRTLSPQEEETVVQIRTFLTKARVALSNEDLDGAFTLATKAKVLLDELNKS
jgi:hypothetical protein